MIDEEQIKQIRKKLEELAEESRTKYQSIVNKTGGAYVNSLRIKIAQKIHHGTYVEGLNNALEIFCEMYNTPFEPIKSNLTGVSF